MSTDEREDTYDYSCPEHGVTFDLISDDGIIDRYYSLGDDAVLLLGRIDTKIPYLSKATFTENIFEWQFIVRSYTDEGMTFSVAPLTTDWEEFYDGLGN